MRTHNMVAPLIKRNQFNFIQHNTHLVLSCVVRTFLIESNNLNLIYL